MLETPRELSVPFIKHWLPPAILSPPPSPNRHRPDHRSPAPCQQSGGEERDGASETEDETSPSEDDASSADASSSSSSLVSMMHVGSMVSPPMASTGTPGSGAKRFGGRAFGHAPVALASRRRALEAMGVYGTSPAAVPSGATPQSDLSSMMGSMPMAGSSLGVHWRPAGALHQPR